MGENKVNNLFEFALNNNQLAEFILGKGNYFVLNREIGEHWSLGSYKQYIVPYLELRDNVFNYDFWHRLADTIKKQQDKNIFIDYLVGYLIPYYHSSDKQISNKRRDETPNFFIHQIKQFMSDSRESLMRDKRGTGVEWNSNNGLYESILSNLETIEKRGGPKFLATDTIL